MQSPTEGGSSLRNTFTPGQAQRRPGFRPAVEESGAAQSLPRREGCWNVDNPTTGCASDELAPPLPMSLPRDFVGWAYSPTVSRGTVDASVGEYAHPTQSEHESVLQPSESLDMGWEAHASGMPLKRKPMSKRIFLLGGLFTATAAGIVAAAAIQPPAPAAKPAPAVTGKAEALTPQQAQFFETKVRPILAEKCYKCNSMDTPKLKG